MAEIENPVRGYRGHPDKQKNPSAANLWKAKDKTGPLQDPAPSTSGKKPGNAPRTMPASINKPTALHDASKQVTKTGSPFSDSAFVHNVTERELHLRETFSPAAPTLTQLSRDMFTQLSIDKPDLTKRLIPEELDYYSAAMLWFRIICLKSKNQQPLTAEEVTVLDMLQLESFTLPEPLRLQLLLLGRVKTVLGTTLRPTFPPLPTAAVQWQGLAVPGNFDDTINVENHNLYEELPCLGIALAALITAQNNHSGPWVPPGVPIHTQANNNLIGYRPTKVYRPESYAAIIDCGIHAGGIENHPPNTGLNFDLLRRTSEVLTSLSTFKMSAITFPSLSEFGTTSQIDAFVPDDNQPGVSNIQGLATIQTINEELHSQIGVALVYAPRYFKVSPENNYNSWCCLSPTADRPADVADPLPIAWYNNRNQRRAIRDIYTLPQYSSVSADAREYRRVTLNALVIARR